MELDVIKNAKRNLLFGTISRIVALICPFVTRTVIQYVLGMEYLGLNSLFTSIISVLSVSELGFSVAIVYCMYKPVAENDIKTVNALLNFYRKAYAVVGMVILAGGICLIPFLDRLIKGSYPNDIDIVWLYMIYLINASISYFMYAYRSSLIVVYQREDITSITNMITTILLTIFQIGALYITHNYLVFTFMMPVFTVINNLRIAFVVKKMFPQYRCEGNVSAELLGKMRQKISGTVIAKVSQMTRNSFDSICISAFVGLAMTAMYNNYYYIINAVTSMLAVFSNALIGGIGNHVVLKTTEENFSELKKLDFVYMNLSGWCVVFILCLIQPFMELWMGKDMMLSLAVVILLCIYFYLMKIGDMRSVYSSTNGLWWEHRYRSITEAGMNIVLNILWAKYFGLYGIITATIITIFCIDHLWGAFITFKNYFGTKRLKEYWIYQIRYFLITVAVCFITYTVCIFINVEGIIKTLSIRFMICIFIPGMLYLIFYGRTRYFRDALTIIFDRKQR